MNQLPANWKVLNDKSDLFKETVIKFLNKRYQRQYRGSDIDYYGIINGESSSSLEYQDDCVTLTLPEFIALTSTVQETTNNLFKFC